MAGSYIVAGARTPIGKLSGALAQFTAAELGGFAIEAALARAGVRPDDVAAVAAAGVDLISMGWLTHSAPNLDVALDL